MPSKEQSKGPEKTAQWHGNRWGTTPAEWTLRPGARTRSFQEISTCFTWAGTDGPSYPGGCERCELPPLTIEPSEKEDRGRPPGAIGLACYVPTNYSSLPAGRGQIFVGKKLIITRCDSKRYRTAPKLPSHFHHQQFRERSRGNS